MAAASALAGAARGAMSSLADPTERAERALAGRLRGVTLARRTRGTPAG